MGCKSRSIRPHRRRQSCRHWPRPDPLFPSGPRHCRPRSFRRCLNRRGQHHPRHPPRSRRCLPSPRRRLQRPRSRVRPPWRWRRRSKPRCFLHLLRRNWRLVHRSTCRPYRHRRRCLRLPTARCRPSRRRPRRGRQTGRRLRKRLRTTKWPPGPRTRAERKPGARELPSSFLLQELRRNCKHGSTQAERRGERRCYDTNDTSGASSR
jgi:hypothetical protein